jgi:YVTN family beta-propeller protein
VEEDQTSRVVEIAPLPRAAPLARTASNRYNNRFDPISFETKDSSFGVPMSFRRVGWLAAIALATLLEISCGQVYRPVVIPIDVTPPNPGNFHAVFAISANSPFNPGSAMQIDVSGDSNIGAANMGFNPTHIAVLPNNSRVFVSSAGSMFQGEADAVMAFTPAADSSVATGLGNPVLFSMPYGSLPIFVNTTQTGFVYVANYGTNSVTSLNTSTNAVNLTGPVGSKPIALAETPDALNLYVLNQADNTVTDLAPQDLSTITTIPVGNMPTWAAVRLDGHRVYVVTQGDGQLYTINTQTNSIITGSPQSVGGPGANFAMYDKSRNRLYVTNPTAGAVYVFDATTDPPTPLGSATGAVSIPAPPIPAGTAPCVGAACSYSGVMPVSVAALPDGSRFYVASYVTAAPGSPCPDANVAASGCVIPQVTVYDAASLTVKTTVFPLLSEPLVPLPTPQFALTPAAFCAPAFPGPYGPSFARFRMSAAAAEDGTRVYASMCDGGSVAVITTTTSSISTGSNTTDTLVTDVNTPFGAGNPVNGLPPLQNPLFLLTGQ